MEIFVQSGDKKRSYDYALSMKRDHGSGNIWEWTDKSADKHDIEVLREIASSNRTVIRFYGTQYRKDFVVPEKDKRAIKQIFQLYEALGGKLP